MLQKQEQKDIDGRETLVYFAAKPAGMVESLERLCRMARVLVAPLRVKIMTALSVRPMSPKMFQEEFGGGQLSRIDHNFKELERFGWLDLLEIRSGGKRRGGSEHVYRAVQLPLFDSSTWPALPKAMRELYSWGALTTLIERAEEALVAGTMDARADRHLACVPGLADRIAWDGILGRADSLFGFILEELRSADCRLVASGNRGIPLTAALAVFESPSVPTTSDRSVDQLGETDVPPSSVYPFSIRMAKAMIDTLRILILTELSTRVMSAREFFEEFGGGEITRDRVYRAFRTLKQFDWLVLADTKIGGRRRGGTEYFYRAAQPPALGSTTWTDLPGSAKSIAGAKIFDSLAERMRDAIEARTMDASTDRHLTWTPGVVDQLGWDRIVGRLDDLFDFAREELKSAEARLAKSGEEPIPMTIALAAFESPPVTTRAH